MRVLVTGGAGFIGSHIVDGLVEDGHEVALVDDLSTGDIENLNPEARLYAVSIATFEELNEVFEKVRPEVVNHHAAQTSVRQSMVDPSFDALVNIVGSINVLRLCVKYGVSRVIFASTCAVYSEPVYLPMDESHPIRPQSAYGMSKHAVENYVRFYADAYGLRYKVFRYGNVYGPRQNPEGEAGVVAIFAGQLLSGVRPTIYGDGTKTRDYVFVQDLVKANLLAMDEVGDNEIFNLAGGVEVTDLEIFKAVCRATGASVEPTYAPKRPGEADRVGMDCSKAGRILGWSATTALDEGIERAVSYHRRKVQLGGQ